MIRPMDSRPAQSPADSSGGQPLPDPRQLAEHRQRRMRALARGMDLYLRIEDLALDWLEEVCGPDLSRQEAILALLAGLKGGLQQPDQSG